MIIVLFQKLVPEARLPVHGTEMAAGYDLFPLEGYKLEPGERHLYQTGLAIAMPDGIYGRIAPRSGLAYKTGIDVLAGVIDPDYRKDVGVILLNTGKEAWTPPLDKEGKLLPIAQIIFEHYYYAEIGEVPTLPAPVSSRDGGFGHTDEKKIETRSEPSTLTDLYNKHGGVQVKERYSEEVRKRMQS